MLTGVYVSIPQAGFSVMRTAQETREWVAAINRTHDFGVQTLTIAVNMDDPLQIFAVLLEESWLEIVLMGDTTVPHVPALARDSMRGWHGNRKPPRLLVSPSMHAAMLRHTWTNADLLAMAPLLQTGSPLITLFEDLVLRGAAPALFAGVQTKQVTALGGMYIRGNWDAIARDLVSGKTQIVETRVVVEIGGRTLLEIVVPRARGAVLIIFRHSIYARVNVQCQWNGQGLNWDAMKCEMWAHNERLDEGRTLEDHGVDDESPLTFRCTYYD